MDEQAISPVAEAFSQLAAALQAEFTQVDADCVRALEEHDLANLERTRALADRLAGLREGVLALGRGYQASEHSLGQRRRRYLGRLDPGKITPRQAYRRPILQALVDLGGQADAETALRRIGELLRDQLNAVDKQPVPSRPNVPRWRNAAHSCRGDMLKEGLFDQHAPRGVWKLSDAGRAALAADTSAAPAAEVD